MKGRWSQDGVIKEEPLCCYSLVDVKLYGTPRCEFAAMQRRYEAGTLRIAERVDNTSESS